MTPDKEGIVWEGAPIPQQRFFVAARKALRWSQGDLATASGVSKSTIADFERGKRQLMRNNFMAICRVFGQAGVDFALDDEKIVGVRWPVQDIFMEALCEVSK